MIFIKVLPYFILLLDLSVATSPSYTCQSMYGYCTLSGIEVTKENPEFTINFDSPHPVEAIQIDNSNMPLLTSQICDAFPNIMTLNLNNAGVEVIDVDALKSCTSLKGFQLWNNPINSLDKDVFLRSDDLRHLSIMNSSLKELHEEVFDHLRQLTHLQLTNNRLSFDNPMAFKNLKKLEVLQLYSNELLDMDELKFMMYLPNLKKIYLSDNDILCDRLFQIMEEFKSKGIIVDSTVKTARTRAVAVGNEEGNICIASRDDYLQIIETKSKKGEIPPVSPHHQLP